MALMIAQGRRLFPIKDNVPTRSFPVVTAGLIAINVAVWLFYELPDLDGAVNELAYHPCEVENSCPTIGQGWYITVLTSMFLHGDWLHLIGNMLFLWIFGNNVEDALGAVRYVLFYILGGLAATALQTYITLVHGTQLESEIPNIGASGAVSAVLGAYLVLLPRARVVTLIFIIIIIIREFPAWFFLGFWFSSSCLPAARPCSRRRREAESRSSPTSAASSSGWQPCTSSANGGRYSL